jgi:ribosome-binding factor A
MSNKSYPRSSRVAHQIQRALSELIRREVRDPRLGMVTLTEVQVSKDLSYAKVFYSVLGAEVAQAQEILNDAADMLRGPVGRALGLRHSPELRFVNDELIANGAKLSALISRAVKDDQKKHIDDESQSDDSDPNDGR